MQLFALFKKLFLLIFLTILTQIGGIVYLCYQPLSYRIKRRWNGGWQVVIRTMLFLVLYLLITFLIVPPIAKKYGRVSMPYFSTNKIPVHPQTIFTYLLNRNYVKPDLLAQIIPIAQTLNREHPDRRLVYLDANFPFGDGFPLLPHLSHNDGRKLDLAFCYKNKQTQKLINFSPSFYGYGVCEQPQKGEVNQPNICTKKGYWQYSFLEKLTPQWNKKSIIVDEAPTKRLLQLLAENPKLKKIFIEPHLKNRWGLGNYNKIRYHGCHAVRHDDHIHVQL